MAFREDLVAHLRAASDNETFIPANAPIGIAPQELPSLDSGVSVAVGIAISPRLLSIEWFGGYYERDVTVYITARDETIANRAGRAVESLDGYSDGKDMMLGKGPDHVSTTRVVIADLTTSATTEDPKLDTETIETVTLSYDLTLITREEA